MKKTIFLIIGMIALSQVLKSQPLFGFKAGVNLANQVKTISLPQNTTSIEQDTKFFIGYQLGGFYKLKVHGNLFVSGEVNFSVIGSSMTLFTTDGETHNAHEKLGYIEVPLTIQYRINKIYFGAGPGVGFKIFSKITNFQNSSYDIPYYKTLDAAANVLAGYNVSKKLDVNVRYSHGLVNLFKEAGYAETKNKYFNFSVLYFLQ